MGRPSARAPTNCLGETSPQITLSAQIAGILSSQTNTVFGELKIGPKTANPFAAVTVLETQMMSIAAALPLPAGPRRLVAVGGGLLDAKLFAQAYGSAGDSIDPSKLDVAESEREVEKERNLQSTAPPGPA